MRVPVRQSHRTLHPRDARLLPGLPVTLVISTKQGCRAQSGCSKTSVAAFVQGPVTGRSNGRGPRDWGHVAGLTGCPSRLRGAVRRSSAGAACERPACTERRWLSGAEASPRSCGLEPGLLKRTRWVKLFPRCRRGKGLQGECDRPVRLGQPAAASLMTRRLGFDSQWAGVSLPALERPRPLVCAGGRAPAARRRRPGLR